MISIRIRLLAALLGATALAGCGGAGRTRVASAPPPPAATVQGDNDAALALLLQGNEAGARKRLQGVLKRAPADATALMLAESIDRDPKALLGPDSYAYTARDGDTIVTLAERFLGNRFKAYQLLRYNGLKAPVTLTAGQALRIPGEPAQPEVVRRPEPSRPAAAAAPTPKPRPVAAKPATAAPAANPAAARQARAAGLAALNQGNVAHAVGLLQRARTLDPGNGLIARDLARAERIAATVRARK